MKEDQVHSNTTTQSPNGTALRVRLNPRGTFTFGIAATRLLEAENIQAVRLLWDAATRSVTFHAADPDATGAFKLNRDYPEMRVRHKAFPREVGWKVDTTITLPASWDAEKKTLALAPIHGKTVSV